MFSLLVLWVLLSQCKSNKKNEENDAQSTAIPVKTQAIAEKKVNQPIRISGIVAPQSEVKLSFKIGGIIAQTYANEGDYVQRGQLIASLNATEIQAQVLQAKLAVDKSKRDLDRVQNLFSDSVATLEQLQNAQTGKQISDANLQIASFNQQYAAIYAPTSGRVLRKMAESNELIAPGTPVFVIGSTEQAWVLKVGISDKDIIRTNLGDEAEIKIDAYPDKLFKGIVSQIAQAPNPTSGTFEVELMIQNPQNAKLIAGMVAKATIVPSEQFTAVTIPIQALVEADNDKGFVYVIENNKAKKVQVSIVALQKNEVAIKTSLKVKDKIVVEGANYLTEGTEVRIVQ